ncbi:HD domain-containing phosphohydrolase [Desulforhopalus sp. 52FAK]
MPDSVLLKPTVLLIENDRLQRTGLKKSIEEEGFYVLEANNGQEGLELWSENIRAVRIVITALEMDVAGGLEVVKTIRKEELQYTYVMVLTSDTGKSVFVDCLRSGADDFVETPMVKEELSLRLQGALRQLRLEDHYRLVGGLVQLAAERAGETGVHLLRIKQYCAILAEDLRLHHPALGLTEQMVEDIANLSVLHDIGKHSLPDGLLQKRGRLLDHEYETMKEHTTRGGAILKDMHRQTGSVYLLLGHDIAIAHHERWDGTGYPIGLKGEEIPLAGRIMAFADVFDALLSRRPHKDPFSLSYAEVYIEEEKAKHFDPMIVESYQRLKSVFFDIHNSIQELNEDW